jgi:crotonobetainyl-CoA:carnitine CoA-transferase CaiB-like acyl-CoA transferase
MGSRELENKQRSRQVGIRDHYAAALAAILQRAFLTKPLSHWKDEVIHDGQVIANHVLVPVKGFDGRFLRSTGLQVIGAEKVYPRRAPDVGENTKKVLLELGFSEERVEALRVSGTAPQVPHPAATAPFRTPGKPI